MTRETLTNVRSGSVDTPGTGSAVMPILLVFRYGSTTTFINVFADTSISPKAFIAGTCQIYFEILACCIGMTVMSQGTKIHPWTETAAFVVTRKLLRLCTVQGWAD